MFLPKKYTVPYLNTVPMNTTTLDHHPIIITTTADKDAAKEIARLLVERRLAACVQMFPIESVYFWQDKIYEDNEMTLFVKSKTALFDEIKAAIREVHAYEVPEIIQVPVTDGLLEYLKWIDASTRNDEMP